MDIQKWSPFSALTSLPPLRQLWTPGLLGGGGTQPPPTGRGLCGIGVDRQLGWLCWAGKVAWKLPPCAPQLLHIQRSQIFAERV